MRALLAITLVSCTSSGSDAPIECGDGTMLDGEACVAPATTCGFGTHEENGECVPITGTQYTMRAQARIGADTDEDMENGQRFDVVVFGREPDGSPATGRVVLGSDRAGAGTFAPSTLELGEVHSVARFKPCQASTPGCIGPLELQLALESSPTTPVAKVSVNITAPDAIGSIDHCMTGGNVLYLEGKRYVQRGALTLVDGTFVRNGGTQRAEVIVFPTDPKQGKRWTVEFSTVELGIPLQPGLYRSASASPGPGAARIRIFGESPFSACNFGWLGDFQIHEFVFNTTVQKMTASFRQWCGLESDPNSVVTGCIHIE